MAGRGNHGGSCDERGNYGTNSISTGTFEAFYLQKAAKMLARHDVVETVDMLLKATGSYAFARAEM